jgi:hypothetical protein
MISSPVSGSRSRCATQRFVWAAMTLGISGVLIGTAGNAQTIANRAKTIPARHVTRIEGYIQTQNGYFLAAMQNGGIGGPDSGNGATALHTDATQASTWESFTLVIIDDTHFALKTANGHYVTAVNGGGIGSTPGPQQPIVTNATAPGGSEATFRINRTPLGTVIIATSSGHFLTAVNAGGFGGPNNTPIHTDATVLGPWETFTWVPIVVSYRQICPDPQDGCLHGGTKNSPTCTVGNALSFTPPQCTAPSNPGAQ